MNYNKKIWIKNIIALVIIMMYIIGVIGGFGNLIYFKQYVPAIGVLISGWLAFPIIKEHWNTIFNND